MCVRQGRRPPENENEGRVQFFKKRALSFVQKGTFPMIGITVFIIFRQGLF